MNPSKWGRAILIHEPFEELSALAAAGQISPADWERLQTHLHECEACRAVFAESEEIHGQWLPERNNFEIARDPRDEAVLKSRVLKQISRNGGKLSKAARGVSPRYAVFAWWQKIFVPALCFAAGVILVVITNHLVRSGASPVAPREQQAQTKLSPSVVTAANNASSAEGSSATGNSIDVDAVLQRETQLAEELDATRAHEKELQQALLVANAGKEKSEQSESAARQQASDLQQQLQNVRLAETRMDAEMVSLKESLTTREVVSGAQEQEIRQLHDKLDAQSASLAREKELMSEGREIRDLIAARNLHIVDVYDTDETGRTKKSFGRAFYTEGKSLVFYAYDLPTNNLANAKYAYYAWGKRDNAVSANVHKLGILYNDDQAQRRWVLTVTDPNVLAAIDSVFVTLERNDGSSDGPRGKKVLSTYLLGPPNHP